MRLRDGFDERDALLPRSRPGCVRLRSTGQPSQRGLRSDFPDALTSVPFDLAPPLMLVVSVRLSDYGGPPKVPLPTRHQKTNDTPVYLATFDFGSARTFSPRVSRASVCFLRSEQSRRRSCMSFVPFLFHFASRWLPRWQPRANPSRRTLTRYVRRSARLAEERSQQFRAEDATALAAREMAAAAAEHRTRSSRRHQQPAGQRTGPI